jgi:hypothetical protein
MGEAWGSTRDPGRITDMGRSIGIQPDPSEVTAPWFPSNGIRRPEGHIPYRGLIPPIIMHLSFLPSGPAAACNAHSHCPGLDNAYLLRPSKQLRTGKGGVARTRGDTGAAMHFGRRDGTSFLPLAVIHET